jgi:hypothetical protein
MRRVLVASLVFLLALGAAAIARTHPHKKSHKKKTSHAKAAITAKHTRSVSHDTSSSSSSSNSSSESADEPLDPHAKARFTSPPDAKESPAYKYGTMDADACYAALDARKISYTRETARGVYAPVRLTGPLHGVTFHSDVAAKDRATSPYEIASCRLVLALDDFAALLAEHDIVDVQHYSMWRPPAESWPADEIAKRHPGATAIDVAHLVKKDGTKLSVLDDFHGAIGDLTCGDGAAPREATPAAIELRAILCEAMARRIFNVALTPDYNKPHQNHFHLEVTSGVTWFLVH